MKNFTQEITETIDNLGLDREGLDELYNSQEIDAEDDTLDSFIENHDWMFIPSLGIYIQREELEYDECSDDTKNFILNLAD